MGTQIAAGGNASFFGCPVTPGFLASLRDRDGATPWSGLASGWPSQTALHGSRQTGTIRRANSGDLRGANRKGDREEVLLARWMRQYQLGDSDAFEALHRALAPRLRWFFRQYGPSRDRVEDLLQESFLQIHRSRHSFQANRPVLPWAMAIANYVQLMERRSLKSKYPSDDAEELAVDEIPAPHSTSDRLADRLRLDAALSRIAPKQSRCFLLHHVWGYGFDDVGRMLGISPGAAKNRSFRAVSHLRTLLSEPSSGR